MIALLFLCFGILILYQGVLRTKIHFNPLTFFIVFWTFWSILSTFNMYQMFEVTNKTYFLIGLNIFGFSLGFLIIAKKQSNIALKSFIGSELNLVLLMIEIVLFVTLIYYLGRYNQLLRSLPVTESRNILFEQGYLLRSYTEYIFYNYFITFLLYGSILINTVEFITNKRRNFTYILSIANVLLFTSIGLGRLAIFNLILILMLTILIMKEYKLEPFFKNKNSKLFLQKDKIKLSRFAPALIAGILVMTAITASRLGTSISSIRSLVELLLFSFKQGAVYFLGPFRTLDYFIKLNLGHNIGYTLGRATFSGLEEILNNVAILFGYQVKTANTIMSIFTVNPIVIGYDGQTFNAFYTGISNFYLDGGTAFVFLIPLFFGGVVGCSWNLFNRYPTTITFSLLIYLVKMTINYQYRWDFSTPSEWIVIVFLSLLIILEKKNYTVFLEGDLIDHENTLVN